MPAVLDIVRLTVITEIDGVATQNQMHYQITDVGSDPTSQALLALWLIEYQDIVRPMLSNVANFACFIYENLTTNEAKALLFGTAVGALLEDSHPQDQVIRFNQYAQDPPNPVHRGAFNLSGVGESLSEDGRINNLTDFATFSAWMTAPLTLPGVLLVMQMGVRFQLTPGPPATFDWEAMILAQANPAFLKLSSRKASLCGNVS